MVGTIDGTLYTASIIGELSTYMARYHGYSPQEAMNYARKKVERLERHPTKSKIMLEALVKHLADQSTLADKTSIA